MSTSLEGKSAALTNTRLLYVDDEVDILRIVQKGLACYGFAVDVLINPQEATNLDLSQYDMIVLDIRMPKIDGFQLYESIKNKIDPSKTKVCFFTAFQSYFDQYNQIFPKWDGCCFMLKPMSVKILAANLHELLGR